MQDPRARRAVEGTCNHIYSMVHAYLMYLLGRWNNFVNRLFKFLRGYL